MSQYSRDPQIWKIACVIIVALFFIITYVVGPIVEPMIVKMAVGKWFVVMVTTFLNVCALAYILLPIFVQGAANGFMLPGWNQTLCRCFLSTRIYVL